VKFTESFKFSTVSKLLRKIYGENGDDNRFWIKSENVSKSS